MAPHRTGAVQLDVRLRARRRRLVRDLPVLLLTVCLRLPHDVLLSVGRRPRLADLYAEVEQLRGDSFRADWRITDLIRHANTCGAPDPGVVCPDDGPDFTALQEQVRERLKKDPRKEPEMARRSGRALCDGCTDHN
ncbi:hypothetical protein [Streptomyces sp. RLB3-17]|uniref:hypothetical protein n=1 Tax=Streptomyces sp. RLB3-17 TaxID=2594455 RepID=UPI0019683132|nr:hypothetical protein [Streptomyces sp. RLB3-17]